MHATVYDGLIMPQKIALLGGTFDPVHIGHLSLAEWVYEELQLDQLLLLPAAVPPHKQHSITPASQRLEMLQLAVKDDPRLSVSDYEIRRAQHDGQPSYTLHSLQHFAQLHQGDTLWWIIGLDSLYQLHHWHEFEQFPHYARFAVLPRPVPNAPDLKAHIHTYLPHFKTHLDFLEMPELAVSSSAIRRRLAQGKTCRYLLPHGVWKWIQEKQLYASS